MLKQLAAYINQHQLIKKNDRVLIAASAGIDSTVLCHLLHEMQIEIGVAHCNFQLRGAASDQDERFVKELAQSIKVPFYSESFDTETYAKDHKISIQMAARDLRYDWLWQLVKEENYQLLATAHHLDDNIETVLFNFAKGTGIKGMRGILPIKNRLIRPLLFASKTAINTFAKQAGIQFREDESNQSDKYTRNKIRQRIIPEFERIHHPFQQSAGKSIRHLRDVEQLYQYAVQQLSSSLMKFERDKDGQLLQATIDLKALLAAPAPATLLYEMLKSFGFHPDQVNQILQRIDYQPGAYFYSEKHRLLVDRNSLILEPIPVEHSNYVIPLNPFPFSMELPNGLLQFKLIQTTPGTFSSDPNIAYFDADSIKWPLQIRHWNAGDRFQPLGMNGRHKKLQDYFSNEKLSRSEKEKVWIMTSDQTICWVLGFRVDERFKVTTKTLTCLVVTFLPGNFAKPITTN